MSWVISTCMAWIGVVLAVLDPMSASGAPRRATPPAGSRAAAMARDWRAVDGEGRSRLRSRTQMASRETMHGESTQALDSTHWIGLRGARHRASGVLVWSGVREEGRTKRARSSEDGQTRSDCHSAMVRNRASNERARVSTFGAETIGCHGKNGRAGDAQALILHTHAVQHRCHAADRKGGLDKMTGQRASVADTAGVGNLDQGRRWCRARAVEAYHHTRLERLRQGLTAAEALVLHEPQ
jgi:hypothetical protein